MNPLTLPVGVAMRVLGDLTAIAAAARAMVPAAEGMAKVDFEQVQDDLHVLAGVARDLPRVEGELTWRMDEAEDSVGRAVEAAEKLVAGMPEIVAGVEEMRRAREAAEKLASALPTIERAAGAAEALADAAPEIESGIPEIARARAAAEKLADALPMLERAADAAEKLSGEGLDEVRASRESLLEARTQARELIAASERAQKSLDRASDNVEAALARAEPLQGLAERVGRLSERLPGGGRPGAPGDAASPGGGA